MLHSWRQTLQLWPTVARWPIRNATRSSPTRPTTGDPVETRGTMRVECTPTASISSHRPNPLSLSWQLSKSSSSYMSRKHLACLQVAPLLAFCAQASWAVARLMAECVIGCHTVGTRLSHGCHTVVTRLSHSCCSRCPHIDLACKLSSNTIFLSNDVRNI